MSIPVQCKICNWQQQLTLSFVFSCWAVLSSVLMASFILSLLHPSPAHTRPETCCRVCQILLAEQNYFKDKDLLGNVTFAVSGDLRRLEEWPSWFFLSKPSFSLTDYIRVINKAFLNAMWYSDYITTKRGGRMNWIKECCEKGIWIWRMLGTEESKLWPSKNRSSKTSEQRREESKIRWSKLVRHNCSIA